MEEIYNFFNRNEGGSVKLRLMEDGRYLLETVNVNYFTEHNHEGAGGIKELCAVDPDGGPMLKVGGHINDWLIPECSDENLISVKKIEMVDGLGYVFTLSHDTELIDHITTFEEFRSDIVDNVKKILKENPHLRYGQAIFNYIEEKYGVARYVQFNDGIDCFYNDDKVELFIEDAWNWFVLVQKGRK